MADELGRMKWFWYTLSKYLRIFLKELKKTPKILVRLAGIQALPNMVHECAWVKRDVKGRLQLKCILGNYNVNILFNDSSCNLPTFLERASQSTYEVGESIGQ